MSRFNSRAYHLKRNFGITESQYSELLRKQGGNCGVCKKPAAVFNKRLAVDHNHKTREIRGLLCTHCNRYVIGRHSNPELFLNASLYLRQGTDLFVPERPRKRRKRRAKKRR